MYNETSIQLLTDRIAWEIPMQPNTEITLSTENVEGVSNRFYSSFHPLAIVENIHQLVVNKDIVNDDFNDFLYKLKKDCALEVLNKVFDNNPYARVASTEEWISLNYKSDYTSEISDKVSLFDDCLGYAMACKCLQLIISSTRSNNTQRKTNDTYNELKIELDGLMNQDGVVVAKGLKGEYALAIANTIQVLFPIKSRFKSKIYGRKPW